MLRKSFVLKVIGSISLAFPFSLLGECLGKVELAPAYVHIDVIESRRTIKELDMAGVRAEAAVVLRGYFLKPYGLYGKEKDGELSTIGLTIGHCLPIGDRILITPQAGISYTNLNTTIHLDLGWMGEMKFRERFYGWAPGVGLEVVYRICSFLRVSSSAQYAWSHSKTKIKELLDSKSDAEGPSYSVMLEYDLNPCWSINIAAAYNESFSKEKNGIRGRGGKIGVARWF